MIVYVDLEHERMQHESEIWKSSRVKLLRHKYMFEDISGDSCLIVRYNRLNPTLLDKLNVHAVLVSGCYTEFEHYPEESLKGLRAVFREAARPTIAFCGGHHLLAQTYGATIGPIGSLGANIHDLPHDRIYTPGMKQERGFTPVSVCRSHPLFSNLNRQPVFFQSHYWEVKSTPSDFQLLAKSDLCAVQAIASTRHPLFGCQFHPEDHNATHLEGRALLKNFFTLAGS